MGHAPMSFTKSAIANREKRDRKRRHRGKHGTKSIIAKSSKGKSK